jgi:anthranilate synthase component 2
LPSRIAAALILVIDNYDSFVYNLARYLCELGQEVRVARNDELSPADALALRPAAIVLSPGPRAPADAGVCVPLIRALTGRVPILGVCLGHQALAAAFGGRVVRAERPMHGVSSSVEHDGRGVFAGLPSPMVAGRYHSLVVEEASLPAELLVSARCRDAARTVMAIRHREATAVGVQFHPESVLTPHGHRLLANFLRLAGIALPPTRGAAPAEKPVAADAS